MVRFSLSFFLEESGSSHFVLILFYVNSEIKTIFLSQIVCEILHLNDDADQVAQLVNLETVTLEKGEKLFSRIMVSSSPNAIIRTFIFNKIKFTHQPENIALIF